MGQPAFEQARGVLMQCCGYTADEALTAIREVAMKTETAPASVVAAIRSTPMLAIGQLDLCAYPASHAPRSRV
jgi:hypothetical protein